MIINPCHYHNHCSIIINPFLSAFNTESKNNEQTYLYDSTTSNKGDFDAIIVLLLFLKDSPSVVDEDVYGMFFQNLFSTFSCAFNTGDITSG